MSELSRRKLVATAAALPALAVPAVAVANTSEPDPIFALIADYQAAHDAFEAYPEEDSFLDELSDQCHKLRCQLAETVPVTLAGVIAIMKYRRELQHECVGFDLFSMPGDGADPRDDITAWLAVIERSLENIARRAA